MHKQKHQHYSHHQRYDDHHLSTSADNIPQQRTQHHSAKPNQQQVAIPLHHHHHHQQSQQQPHQHQQRKHSQSHSPHQSRHPSPHSRHTSPHNHHSHSLHSSPHQSYLHVDSNSYENGEAPNSPPRTAHSSHRASIQSSSSHSHHHHNHRRRSRRHHSGGASGNSNIHCTHGTSHRSQERATTKHHGNNCSRRHRSATDILSATINANHDTATCTDRDVEEMLVQKTCCSSSGTELAQFFAEDLYGSSRRPSSCCTSSDYCYQTDSTSLYASRSSLSRNNSVKSASVAMRKKRALHQRQPSYTSISLRGLGTSCPNSRQHVGSLSSVFDRKRSKLMSAEPIDLIGSSKPIVSSSKVTIERQTSKDTLSQELPDYACSPSPIRWSFLADEKSQSEIDIWRKSNEFQKPNITKQQIHCRQPKHHRSEHTTINKTMQNEGTSRTSISLRKFPESPFSCDFEETSTTVLFHQEGEAYNNCCNSYIQCNTYLDQDLQITSEDIHQYLSKGCQNGGDVLNNSKSYPFQPTNALEFQYKNNFANNSTEIEAVSGTATATGTGTAAESSEAESLREANASYSRQRFLRQNSSKDTNINNFWDSGTPAARPILPCRNSTPLSATNINLSSSSNNINVMYNASAARTTDPERNANEVKFINTIGQNVALSTEAHHTSYLPNTQSVYDYSNMSSNSLFNKPLCIDELPKELDLNTRKSFIDNSNRSTEAHIEGSSSDGQHSSPLPSPVRKGVSFESFDASSDHNLISQRDSCQFSLPPESPACSSLPASVNPSATSYVYEEVHHNTHSCQNCTQKQQHQHWHHDHHHHRSPVLTMHHSHCNHGYDCHHQHISESFKLSNALKKVRKRARKYTEFLRKK